MPGGEKTQESTSTDSVNNNQNKTAETELTTKDRIENALIGASFGMAVGGAVSMVIAMPAIVVVGPVASAQAFSYGALAFNFVAIVVAPFLNVDLEPIEWDSVSVDNTNSTPVYGVYE